MRAGWCHENLFAGEEVGTCQDDHREAGGKMRAQRARIRLWHWLRIAYGRRREQDCAAEEGCISMKVQEG